MRYRLGVIALVGAAGAACSNGPLDAEHAGRLISALEQFKRESRFTIQTGVPLQSAFKCLSQEQIANVPANRFVIDRGWVRYETREGNLGFGTTASCPALGLTASGQAASAGWTRGRAGIARGDGASWAIPIGARKFLAVTKLTTASDESAQVEFDWKWSPNETGTVLRESFPGAGALFDQTRKGRASCRRTEDGWRCQLGMWTTPADALGELPSGTLK